MSVKRAVRLVPPLLIIAALFTSAAGSRAAPSAPSAMWNIHESLAIGVPGEDIDGAVDAGAVHVMLDPGSHTPDLGHLFLVQGDGLVEDAAESGDRFGEVLAGGDLNGNGMADLVVGVPFEDVNGKADAGAIHVFYDVEVSGGSILGQADQPRQFWHQSLNICGGAEAGDRFGNALAIGDFNFDGYEDLAVGAPGEGLAPGDNAGVVHILYGSADGLVEACNVDPNAGPVLLWHQDQNWWAADPAEEDDFFGAALMAGDFNGDTYADLAIGIPLEDYWAEGRGTLTDAGAVNVLFGSADGLTADPHQWWSQEVNGVTGTGEALDRFGEVLARGDFNGDGYHDLAIGVPGETVDGASEAGAVNVIYGTTNGLSAGLGTDIPKNEYWTENDLTILGTAEAYDCFGCSLAAGDEDGDGFEDLTIGVPNKDLGPIGGNHGMLHYMEGSPDGLSWYTLWDGSEPGDQFGTAIAKANLGDVSGLDEVVGAPGAGSPGSPGAVYIRRDAGLAAEELSQGAGGIPDQPEDGDFFGAAAAALRPR